MEPVRLGSESWFVSSVTLVKFWNISEVQLLIWNSCFGEE